MNYNKKWDSQQQNGFTRSIGQESEHHDIVTSTFHMLLQMTWSWFKV